MIELLALLDEVNRPSLRTDVTKELVELSPVLLKLDVVLQLGKRTGRILKLFLLYIDSNRSLRDLRQVVV